MREELTVTKKQKAFIDATESEVLFGGAAGGGKSYGQMVDALLFAMKYPASKQLVLRRTFAELDKSLIRTSLALFPKEIYTFNSSSHTGRFKNGSIIDFGYCAAENDVYQYQSAEYDVIRFDELTHFTENQYVYLIPLLKDALSKLKGSLDSVRESGEKLNADTKVSIAEMENSLCALEKNVNHISSHLEGYEALMAERGSMRKIIEGQIDMLYAIFMSSSLPQYQKDEVGAKIQSMREELVSYEESHE